MSLSMVFSNRMAPRIRSPVKLTAGYDSHAHLMYERKHLSLIGPGIFLDSIRTERLGRAATALVQGRNETGTCLHFLKLLCVVTHFWSPKIFEPRSCQIKIPDHSVGGCPTTGLTDILKQMPGLWEGPKSSERSIGKVVPVFRRVARFKIAVLEPIPRASVSMATAVKTGDLRIWRRAKRQSPRSEWNQSMMRSLRSIG